MYVVYIYKHTTRLLLSIYTQNFYTQLCKDISNENIATDGTDITNVEEDKFMGINALGATRDAA